MDIWDRGGRIRHHRQPMLKNCCWGLCVDMLVLQLGAEAFKVGKRRGEGDKE